MNDVIEQDPAISRVAWPEHRERRHLPTSLTPEEIASNAEELARCQLDLQRIESEKKEAADDFKARLSSTKARIEKLSLAITDREIQKSVPCEWRYEVAGFDADGNEIYHPEKKTLVRLDTRTSVEVRDITDEERQGKLKLEANAAGEAALEEDDEQHATLASEPGAECAPPTEQPADLLEEQPPKEAAK